MSHLIVGGGPVGGYLASQLKNATIIDQKEHAGSPVRCTGILTKDIQKFLSAKELKQSTLNIIKSTIIHGPTKSVELNIGKNYIICNKTFEQQFIEKAEKNGAKILLKHKYIGSTGSHHHIRDMKSTKGKTIKSTHLIGCDGPKSQVNKVFNIQKKKKNYLGYQITLKVKEHENNIQFFPTIGKYAWYVPESEQVARVGVCATQNPKAIFEAFRKKFSGKQLDIQAGFIPYHQPFQKNTLKTTNVQISLLGDSASHIKNTTGGGIIPGIKAANHFTKTKNNYKGTSGKIQRELHSHFIVHNVLKHCSHKEWDQIITAVSKNAQDIENINRDQLWKLAPTLIKNPLFMKIGFKKIIQRKAHLI